MMTDESFTKLKEWIATDPGDYAQRIRETLRPMVMQMSAHAAAFTRWCEQSDHHRRAVMRRKIRRMVRYDG